MDAEANGATRAVPVEFTGNASDYFKIWIVNTALTIVTIGIYSAWAQVRKLRYFYTHTSIEDGHFDFHAQPMAILIGRAIAVAFLGLYVAVDYFAPGASLVVLLIVLLLVPILVVRSRIFRMRNTSLHGLRFNFQPNYKDAFKAYYGGALFTLVTLGLGAPTALYLRNRFGVVNSGYGKTQFEFAGESGEFYSIVWKSIGIGFLGVLVVFMLSMFAFGLQPAVDPESADADQVTAVLMGLVTTLPIVLVYLLVGVYVQVRLRNYVWNSSSIGNNRIVSDLAVLPMMGLYLTNLLGIILSAGLLIPWAQIRLARYRAAHTSLVLEDDWATYTAANRDAGSALGDEFGEAFDVDVDIAF